MTLVVKKINGKEYYAKSPDGGWAWVVLLSSFLVTGITFSIAKSLGMFFLDFRKEFETSNSETSWISSTCLSLLGLAAPVGSLLIMKFDARKVVMLSGLLSCIGMVIASFAKSLIGEIVGIGIIWGLGYSWSVIGCSIQIGIYFNKWRALAYGISSSGSSILSAMLPLLLPTLFDFFGWRGSLLILSGFTLNITVCGALIRPITACKVKESRDTEGTTEEDENTSFTIEKTSRKASIRKSCQSFFHKYSVVIILGLGEFLCGLSMFIPSIYIVPFAKELGIDDVQAAFLLSAISIGDFVCRLVSGITQSLLPALNKRLLLCMSTILFCISAITIIAVTATGYDSLLAFAIAYGCFFGLYLPFSLSSVVVLLGVENIEKFVGPRVFANGLGTLISPPIAGLLVDHFGTYRVAYVYSSLFMILSSMVELFCYIIIQRRGYLLPEKRKQQSVKSNSENM